MTGLTTGSAANVGKRVFDKVFSDEIAQYESAKGRAYASHPIAFMQDSTDQASVRTERLATAGYFTEKAEEQNVPSSSVRLGDQKESVIIEYANSIDIPRTVFNDDQHSIVSRSIKDFAQVAMISRDRAAFGAYRNGFTTETTGDGVALYSNSHESVKGFALDNLETGVASDANVEVLINSLRTQKDASGVLRGYEPRLLLAPTALHKDLQVITKSTLRSGTGNNDLNYYSEIYPELTVMYSPFLDSAEGGSDTAYYLFAQRHGTFRFVREALWTRLVNWEGQRNNNYIYKAGFREIVDSIDPAGTVASNGTV